MRFVITIVVDRLNNFDFAVTVNVGQNRVGTRRVVIGLVGPDRFQAGRSVTVQDSLAARLVIAGPREQIPHAVVIDIHRAGVTTTLRPAVPPFERLESPQVKLDEVFVSCTKISLQHAVAVGIDHNR